MIRYNCPEAIHLYQNQDTALGTKSQDRNEGLVMEKGKNHLAYEYMSKTVKAADQTRISDLCEAFGWEATDAETSPLGVTTISFRRNRKIPHRSELVRLERKADSIWDTLGRLDKSKRKGASLFAYVFGCFAVLIFGAGLSLTMRMPESAPALVGGIVLGLAGILLGGLNLMLFRRLVDKKTREVNPVMEDMEEKLAVVCEQAHGLLDEPEI